MPHSTLPHAPHYVPAPGAKEDLDYADLAVIDLAKASTPAGRTELASEVKAALLEHGFFYVINHGYSQTQTERMFDIADVPFSGVPEEEKQVYAGTMKQTGSYQGYKLRQYWHIDAGVFDQLEHYNVNRDITKRAHPEALRPFLPEIKEFARHNHYDILHPILRLIALSLELPEDALVDIHRYDAVGETYGRSLNIPITVLSSAHYRPRNRYLPVRFMKYYPRSEEEEQKTGNVWLKGHTDFGSITILWSQPVAALQIQTRDGNWRWIRHVENALVVNAGDALDFLTGSFYKGTIHRVVQPPLSQQAYTRLGLFYFVMPDDAVKLIPLSESPVLQRAGIHRRCADADAPTMEEWRRARTSAYGQSELKKTAEEGVEEEVINGVVVRHYN
ncbi:Clavaminate synthase-like protein [Hygrophoropsis aurantiaca]|uniref:Clavaminate synthase-like protein n=1 Tax=Hygrophoropsis aurantiaca TaxID=72124 RepID=A0ACB8ASL9_9AGAM|nr:Clavaminate synthase-like protein [Hygrophoropsis aurantiaca]